MGKRDSSSAGLERGGAELTGTVRAGCESSSRTPGAGADVGVPRASSTLAPEASAVLNFQSIKQRQELSLCTSRPFVLSVSLPGLLLHINEFILIFFSPACDSS